MVRIAAILILLAVGLIAIASAAVSMLVKLIGASFWLLMAAVAYLLWRRSRRSSG